MTDAKAWADLGIDADVYAVLEVEFSFQAFGVAARKAVSGVEVLGQPEHEQVAQGIVLASPLEDVADQACAAAAFFLVGDFRLPVLYQGVEIQNVAPAESFVSEAADSSWLLSRCLSMPPASLIHSSADGLCIGCPHCLDFGGYVLLIECLCTTGFQMHGIC